MTQNIRKYSNYSLFDFLLDHEFKQWVLEPSAKTDQYWKQIISEHPDQYETIQKAIKIVKNIPALDQEINAAGKNVLWNQIDKATQPLHHKIQRQRQFNLWRYAAALVIICGVLLGWLYQKNTSLIYIASGNGEIKSVLLPDGSTVLLGPNSTLSYHKDLAEKEQREIWASGDARFDVKHINANPKAIKTGERFIVHLDKKVAVEVLGTVFDISSRRGSSLIGLLSGSVKVSQNQKEVWLKPGESVQTALNKDQLTVSNKSHQVIREWEQQMVLLNRTNIQQIINLIEDTYGIALKVDNTAILQKEIDGVLPLNDREKALQILTSITATSLQEKDGSYLLKEIK